jgi:hypothetical protein
MIAKDHKAAVAVLWDESFLWGIMAYRAFEKVSLPYHLITAAEVVKDVLEEYEILYVPGGWASNKIKALGDEGAEKIRQFVQGGGTYVGVCGGAGLATNDGLGLVDIKRVPTRRRVPSFSGPIRLSLKDDPLWSGVEEPVFCAWWPSQFDVGENVEVLAKYGEALPDAFSSDINVGDAVAAGGWEELEKQYDINLDPGRMVNEPAVVRNAYGNGTVLLSLVHFDSPDDKNGETVLRTIGDHFGKTNVDVPGRAPRTQSKPSGVDPMIVHAASELARKVDDLIDTGIRNFLWFRRNPLLFQWRRGVRGLEYCTLKVMMDELTALFRENNLQETAFLDKGLTAIGDVLVPFAEDAQRLLVLERQALLREKLTYEAVSDPRIRALREHLFSSAKSHGGLFKEVIDRMSTLLYRLLVA